VIGGEHGYGIVRLVPRLVTVSRVSSYHGACSFHLAMGIDMPRIQSDTTAVLSWSMSYNDCKLCATLQEIKGIVSIACHALDGVSWTLTPSAMAQARVWRRVHMSGSQPMFLHGWGEATCRHTRQSGLQLPPTAALTDPDADITDVVPDVEIAAPGIDGPDKKYFPTQKWDPLVFCRIIETFMMGTI